MSDQNSIDRTRAEYAGCSRAYGAAYASVTGAAGEAQQLMRDALELRRILVTTGLVELMHRVATSLADFASSQDLAQRATATAGTELFTTANSSRREDLGAASAATAETLGLLGADHGNVLSMLGSLGAVRSALNDAQPAILGLPGVLEAAKSNLDVTTSAIETAQAAISTAEANL